MALAPGTRLGPYAITASLGAGGMGEVYKAIDTRLNRAVAIKVLPEHVASDPDLKQRFEREAKTLAALSHPHICPIHDVGSQNGIDFLVMEYLEGETLEQRLKKGAPPLDQALQIAIQIADALSAAHRAGIIHRDLKPGNVMLTKSGAKLLDFGLAKTGAHAVAGTLSMLPTTPPGQTQPGAILGTFQYMAPEQLEGHEADARTDIFAFGTVLYEMVTGRKAFEGKSQASLIAAILASEPPAMATLQPLTPPLLDHVVHRCLAKDPDERWQNASDVMRELKWLAEKSASPTTTVAGSRRSYRQLALSAAMALLAAATAGGAVWFLTPASPAPVTRFALSLPSTQRFPVPDEPVIALSPDGTRVAYIATQGGSQQLYLRAMDSSDARPIPGTEGAIAPFFSPDSQWVGFFVPGRLKKVSVNGGAAVTIGDVVGPGPRSATWGSDDTIMFHYAGSLGLWRVPAAGGTPQRLTTSAAGNGAGTHAYPQFLPDSTSALFVAAPGGSASIGSAGQIVVHSLQSSERRDIIAGTRPRYAPTGQLLYTQAGTLMTVPLDPGQMVPTGAPVPVLEGVWQSASTGIAQYDISRTGSLIYIAGGLQGETRRLVWVDRTGVEQTLPAPPRSYRSPRLSPDGRQVAIGNAEAQIWIYDLARETLTRLTFGLPANTPLWTPDGTRIAYQTGGGGANGGMYWQPADGSGGAERLTSADRQHVNGSWSPDGKYLAFVEISDKSGRDISVLQVSDRGPKPFVRTPFNETAPQFSPDGRWLAYASDESGRFEIYVQPFPSPGRKWQISTDGGTEPVWASTGELFYRNVDKMMAVETTTQPAFSPGRPRMLFEGRYVTTLLTMPNYDVSPDGRRFLMVKEGDPSTSSAEISVVLNWFEELKRLVPAN